MKTMISSDFIRCLFSKKSVNHHFKSQPTAFLLRSVMQAMKATSAKRKVVKPSGKGSTKKTFGKGNQADEINSETQQLEKVGPADFS